MRIAAILDREGLETLKDLSARLGRNALLVQAASGNTSIKLDGRLWIKASGKWLANGGADEIFVPVELERMRACLREDLCYTAESFTRSGDSLRPSIETAMHAVLPQRVVIHVHSVNAIAWAVRQDGATCVADLLAGLRWRWIPYVSSGFPLARAIQRCAPGDPDVFVLANHGLVVAGEDCRAAEELLEEVERRLFVAPRAAPAPDRQRLEHLAHSSGWCVPENSEVHALGTDPVSRTIVTGGTLYPCHGLFLGPAAAQMDDTGRAPEAASAYEDRHGVSPTTIVVNGQGVLVSQRMTVAKTEVLSGLIQVIQRIPAGARIRYMSAPEVDEVFTAAAYHYRQQVEASSYQTADR